MGALWVLLGFLVLLLGVDNAAGTVRRSTDRVVRVGGAATSKKSMVHSVPVSQHTGKSLGLKNKPKMSIQPSGKPVNPLGVLHRDRISKKQQPRPVLEKTEVPKQSGPPLPQCTKSHYWHPTLQRCYACLYGGHKCIGNSSCCCPGVQQVGSYCKGVRCEDEDESRRCSCTKDSNCIEGSCCVGDRCRNCERKDLALGNQPSGQPKKEADLGDTVTPRPFFKFCDGELLSPSLNSPINKNCCSSNDDCPKGECCSFKQDKCAGVCKGSCEGKMLNPPDWCGTSASPPPQEGPLHVKCRINEDCGEQYCCLKNSSRPRAKGWCRLCEATASPTMDTIDIYLAFFQKYGFINCSSNEPCPNGLHCVDGECEFQSCPAPMSQVVSLKKNEDSCCKDKHCEDHGLCCRVFYSKAVAVCVSCNPKAGRSFIPPSLYSQPCQEDRNCSRGLCCVELVRGQGKVCSTCDGPGAGLEIRGLKPVDVSNANSATRKTVVCTIHSDCGEGKCCISSMTKGRMACRKCPSVQTDSKQLGCAVSEDCPVGHCCSDISNSPSGQGVCKPCVASLGTMPFAKQMEKLPCSTDDDCPPLNGTTYCCVSAPSEEGKYCIPHRKENSVCSVGILPQFSCPCEARLTCLPAAVQRTGLIGVGVCSGSVGDTVVVAPVGEEVDVKADKKRQRKEQRKKTAEERKKQREARKRQKALKKVSN